ncbi:MAG: hypothetical protein U0Q12_08340 [Vicinamibacterales bacterium]
MSLIAILGAGELGGALAHRLAARDRVREILLVDEATSVAAGKALDIQQSGPVENFGTRLRAGSSANVAGADVIVLADEHSAPAPADVEARQLDLLSRIWRDNARALYVFAGAAHASLVGQAVLGLGMPRARVVGSAPEALAAALRTFVALELDASPAGVTLALLGTPPASFVVPWHLGSADGTPLDVRLGPAGLSRMQARLRHLWPPAPYALASAACAVVEALVDDRRRGHHVFAVADTSGAADRVMAVPVRLGRAGVLAVVPPPLSERDRSILAQPTPRLA